MRKAYWQGGHRAVSPATTLRRALPLAAAAGVTRLADVSGLDRIGLPVFQAIRPMAPSLSLTMGKGLTPDAARVSALMEAIEFHHAEALVPVACHASAAALGEGLAAQWRALAPARGTEPFDPQRPRDWTAATELRSNTPSFAPSGLVRFDLATPRLADERPRTNGLASGNTLAEAQVAALCELIERDSEAAWHRAAPAARAAARLDLARGLPEEAAQLLAMIEAAGCETLAWDLSETHGVPAFLACILDAAAPAAGAGALAPGMGGGCHPDPEVALLRALSEAAQSRVMLVAGTREDLPAALYEQPAQATEALRLAVLAMLPARRRFTQAFGARHTTSEADLAWLLTRLPAQAAVIAVDLTHPAFGLPIVKLFVPGFADHATLGRMP